MNMYFYVICSGYIDSSGLRLWVTPTLRPNDGAVLQAGVRVDSIYQQILPKGHKRLTNIGICSEECLSEVLSEQVIM